MKLLTYKGLFRKGKIQIKQNDAWGNYEEVKVGFQSSRLIKFDWPKISIMPWSCCRRVEWFKFIISFGALDHQLENPWALDWYPTLLLNSSLPWQWWQTKTNRLFHLLELKVLSIIFPGKIINLTHSSSGAITAFD